MTRFISDRWLDCALFTENSTLDNHMVEFFQKWANIWAPLKEMHYAAENYFAVCQPDGRYGLLLEIELDDGSEATPKGVETVRAATPFGEFSYHPPGTVEVWNDRAVYRVFFPVATINAQEIEASAKGIFDHVG